MKLRVVLGATFLLTALVAAADAQTFAYLAFGDSITRGKCDNGDCGSSALGGYPPRLASLLGCSGSVCSVHNKGKDGEKTSAGVTRIDSVLDASTYDVLLLMHGTNDIWNNISNATIKANLAEMESKAAGRGVDTVHASIIRWHPDGPNGKSQDADVVDLRNKSADLASAGNGYFVDTWAVLCPTMSCFNAHYAPIPPDNGLHPDDSGYDIMAAAFYDEITRLPAPGVPTPSSPQGDGGPPASFTWSRESPLRATWYEVAIEGPPGLVFKDWVGAQDSCTDTTCSISPTIEWTEGDHSWRVRGRNPKNRSVWSADQSFNVHLEAPPPAQPIAPKGFFLTEEPLKMTYTWEDAASATDYRLQVLRSGVLIIDQTFAEETVCAGSDCQATPPITLSGADYRWRIQSSNLAGEAPWSEYQSFFVVDIWYDEQVLPAP